MANKKKTGTIIGVIAALAGTYAILRTIGKRKKMIPSMKHTLKEQLM